MGGDILGAVAMEADGLRVILTPVQLAAVLNGESIEEIQPNIWIRVTGGLGVLGGALEVTAGAGLLMAPEPTMLTKVAGGAAFVHGTDVVMTGYRQMLTGRQQSTVTAQLVSAGAQLAGASAQTAGNISLAVDILVPLVVSAGLAAARVMNIRRGMINLAAEEAAGGHTLARHIGKTEAELRARLAAQSGIPAASTFATREAAERAVSEVVKLRAQEIAIWARSAAANAPPKAFTADLGRVVGQGVVRSTGQLTRMTAVRVVLRRTTIDGRLYFVLTAFPVP